MPDRTAGGTSAERSRSCGARLAAICVAVALGIATVAVASPAAAAQHSDAAVRIVARELGDGRVEVGLQQCRTDTGWAERRLPTRRFFPSAPEVGRWLNSSPLSVQIAAGEVVVRIVARELGDGRVEVGLQQRRGDTGWAERRLPTRRFFPSAPEVGRWLNSSLLTLGAPHTTRPGSDRLAAAQLAARRIVCDAQDEEQPTGKSWAAWEKHYNRECERVGIIYGDAGITVFSMFEASDILHTSNSDFSHALIDRATINPDALPHTPEIDPWDRLWHGPHPGQANAVCAVSNPSS